MAAGLNLVRARIAEAARRADRDPSGIRLIGVSKYTDLDGIRRAYDGGLRDFGENRAEAFSTRATELPDDIRWHFVGRLQGNKVRHVRPVAALLHSLDRLSLAEYWLKGPGAPPPVLVQVNVGDEPQKAGVPRESAIELVAHATSLGLDVTGLMALPPMVERPEDNRRHFAALRILRDHIARDHPSVVELSMGMSGDFEVAVEEGASMLRVGRAIFRPSPDEE